MNTIKSADFDPNFKFEIEKELGGEHLTKCFNCTGCTVGCPISEIEPTYNPRKAMRMAILGMKKELFESEIMWLCVSCYTCYDQCPQDVRIADVLNAMKNIAEREERMGHIKLESTKPAFDKVFVDSIQKHGRVYETGVVIFQVLKQKGIKGLLGYTKTGIFMIKKRKLSLIPKNIKGMRQIKNIFRVVRGKT